MLSPLQTWSLAHMLFAAVVAVGASWALRRRVVSDDSRAAAMALRVFWAGLGGTALVQSAMLLGAASGVGPTFAIATVLLAYVTSVAALGALAAYFAFVFTGSRRAIPGVGALYALVLVLGSWGLVLSRPRDLALTRWFFESVYLQEPSGFLASGPAVAALAPATGGAVAFLVLGLRSTGTTRRRGLLVGTALALWFGSALAVSSGAASSDLAQVVRKLTSLAGIVAVYVAYLAPQALQRRWGLAGLGAEDALEDRSARGTPTRRLSEALDARVRELV